jgi:hypothetical protein
MVSKQDLNIAVQVPQLSPVDFVLPIDELMETQVGKQPVQFRSVF